MRAVEDLRREKDFSDLELILVGAGLVPPPLVDGSWVHHIQRPSDSELAALYSNASAFLYPSWYEGYGLPLHEAAAFGTPRIASTAGALPETAPPGTLFADPAKPHHWAEALKMALSMPKPPMITSDPEAWSRAAAILSNTL